VYRQRPALREKGKGGKKDGQALAGCRFFSCSPRRNGPGPPPRKEKGREGKGGGEKVIGVIRDQVGLEHGMSYLQRRPAHTNDPPRPDAVLQGGRRGGRGRGRAAEILLERSVFFADRLFHVGEDDAKGGKGGERGRGRW